MQDRSPADPDFEWLDHVQPVGLVLARSLLKSLGLSPERQTKADDDAVAALIDATPDRPTLSDPWAFFHHILGWQPANVAGAPGGPPLPDALTVSLPDYDTTLSPTWAVRGVKDEAPWQLLIRCEGPGIDPNNRGALAGWEATPHQRFERLLREIQVHAGVLVTDAELRLVYAPKAETSGWIAFPLRPLGTVAGRPMLGGLKLVLGSFRLFNDSGPRRLPGLLRDSREAQASVSTDLSAQVLGALHEPLRGMHAAEPKLIAGVAAKSPQNLYEGLLSVLMRLVFILYAEDRDLIPSKTDVRARALYDQGYSVRGLFAKPIDDEARYPDTMDERVGGWGRLIALFRLVHGGHGSGWIKGRGGKLFDPKAFPFLEGKAADSDPARVIAVSDGAILRVLRGLMVVDGERLSYRTLDVEQIGSVYETVMGFTVETAAGRALAIKAGKNNRTPVFVDLDQLAAAKGRDRLKFLKEEADRGQLSANVAKVVEAAKDADELTAALDPIVDERGSPKRRAVAAGTPILQPTDERRRTGSHYTPRSLTAPIVRHALEPAFERLGPGSTPEQVLALKVCDPAMGSGAFLVEACRTLAARLVKAWARHLDKKPAIPPDEDEDLHARRLVAQRCLYGVDKNPLATDLARLSLWLATLARDHEFTFLDHALKSGDSLVGLGQAQIAATHWDASKPPTFVGKLVSDHLREAEEGRRQIRERAEFEDEKALRGRLRAVDAKTDVARLIGDGVMRPFSPRTRPRSASRGSLLSRRRSSATWAGRLGPTPEVFSRENSGFDAIVGNPPFAGKNTIIASNREGYLDWLKALHEGAHGNSDLVAHFFRRAFGLLSKNGCFGLIATNTIGQGDTRATGLAIILRSEGSASHAVKRLKWPGEAAVVVSVVHVVKGVVSSPILDGRQVARISAYVVEGDLDDTPAKLSTNSGIAYTGSKLRGLGFLFDDQSAEGGESEPLATRSALLARDPKNAERIKPFLGGDELTTSPMHTHYRFVIDFNGMPLAREATLVLWKKLSAVERERSLQIGVVPTDYPDGRSGSTISDGAMSGISA